MPGIRRWGDGVMATAFDLPEGAKVLLTVQSSGLVVPPVVSAPEERARILRDTLDQDA